MSDQHEPRPHRPDDRMGLEAFDAVDVPDQWDDITRRADGAELATSSTGGRRRSPSTWFMAAAAVALVAVAAVAVSVRSGDDSAPTPATTPDETLPTLDTEPTAITTTPTPTSTPGLPTSPPASAPSTAPPSPPSTAVPAAVVTAWEPECVDRFGDAAELPGADPRLDAFTTLGAAPSLEIVLPTVDTANGVVPPLVSASTVPGGVLLVLREFADVDGTSVPVTVVSIVDLDGDVRWRRCLAEDGWYGGALVSSGDAASVWVAFEGGDGGDGHLRWFSPVSGLDLAAPLDLGAGTVVAASGPNALVAARTGDEPIGPDDEMSWFDADEAALAPVPYPAVAVGDVPGSVVYSLVELGDEVVAVATGLTDITPTEIWSAGAWSTRPDDLRRLPPTLRIPFGNDEPLRLLDGAGDVVWEVDGFHTISREGFNNAIADSVVLVMECLDWTDDLGCQWADESTPPREQLSAFDLATGERLWARPGGQSFAAIAGDRGIVTAEVGWELIDLRTGERVDDQPVTAWPQDDIFFNECCGAGDYVWTRLDGGVLFESTGDRLRVWLPPEASTPIVTADAFS